MATSKPFNIAYVMRTTAKHMAKAIDTSIKKTMERMAEFEGDHVKSNEVFNTLTHLHALKKQIETVSSNYSQESAA